MFQVNHIAHLAPRSRFEFVAGGRFVRVNRNGLTSWTISERDKDGQYLRGCGIRHALAADEKAWVVHTVLGEGDDAEFLTVDEAATVEGAISAALGFVTL